MIDYLELRIGTQSYKDVNVDDIVIAVIVSEFYTSGNKNWE